MKSIVQIFLFMLLAFGFTHCKAPKPKKSVENLRIACSNETTSAEKYSRFAQAALAEGFDTIAQLFEAVSKSENIHATNHRNALEKLGVIAGVPEIGSYEVKTTMENLQSSIEAEKHDMQLVYPGFIREAEKEKAPTAGQSFSWALNTEKKHLNDFRQAALAISNANEKGLPFTWLICPKCGNIYSLINVKETCDLCLTRQEIFLGYTNTLQ